VNEAVERAHREGVLSAASLMVAGAAAEQAVALARRMPELRVGLHLTLLDGMPASAPRDIPDLVDRHGRLRDDIVGLAFALLKPAARRQLRREIAAQFSAFRKTGLALDHVNAHRHFHVHPLVAGEVIAACREHGVTALRAPCEPASVVARIGGARPAAGIIAPWAVLLRRRARRARLTVPDAVFGLRWSGAMTAARISALLAQLPPGLVEIYTHPAVSDTFAGHAPGYRYREELAALTDPAVIAAADASGRRPVGFSG
jgi:hopanoid biosynthesis associated protein HpnK